ncbi:MAG: UDP-N-acetylmuramate dehydrogenase [Cellulomonadaceae bacterium]|nr:UDP-N-acetylmuramate dehydrogenase [Cellulomonadaceae bacterium]
MSTQNLADLTTMRVGGPAAEYAEATTEQEFIEAVRTADAAGTPVLIIGGGSNLVVSDAGFPGLVVRDARTGVVNKSVDACGGANITAVAGQDWDELVSTSVDNQWVGMESLSGIPGTVGATPVQNVGAYGQEVSGVISSVRTWDRAVNQLRTFSRAELKFAYRNSMLKDSMRAEASAEDPHGPWYPSPRFVVLDVSFQMRLGRLSAPIGYAELARTLGVEAGRRAPSKAVREAVLHLRAGKGMLQDGRFGSEPGADHNRWSAGSFFTNPIIPTADAARVLPDDAPRYPVRTEVPEREHNPSLGRVDPDVIKTSAAWLIERSGFAKGFGIAGAESPATLSTKHTLALTNRGNARASDIVDLAVTIRDGVRDAFSVVLEPEPILVGLHL